MPVTVGVEDEPHVARLLNLQIGCGIGQARAELSGPKRVTAIREGATRDSEVRRGGVGEAPDERRAGCQCGRVDLRLEVALVNEPVPDVQDDRGEREEDGDEEREDDDDLPALADARAQHAAPTSPVILPPEPPAATARVASWRRHRA